MEQVLVSFLSVPVHLHLPIDYHPEFYFKTSGSRTFLIWQQREGRVTGLRLFPSYSANLYIKNLSIHHQGWMQ